MVDPGFVTLAKQSAKGYYACKLKGGFDGNLALDPSLFKAFEVIMY